jgi:hypothetical protein
MSYEYCDKTRESDENALPDVEVFRDVWSDCPNCEATLLTETWYDRGCTKCNAASVDFGLTLENKRKGWGYAYGMPDYLWDSDPFGPYDTEQAALAAAREQAGCCEHGIPEDGDAICEECPAPKLWTLMTPAGEFMGYPEHGSMGAVGSQWRFVCVTDVARAACWQTRKAAERCREADEIEGVCAYKLTDDEARRWGRS